MRFPHTATIQRLTNSSGKYVYANNGSVKCFLQPADQIATEQFGLTLTRGSVIYLPLGSGVKEKDRLVVNGSTYGVKGVKVHNYGGLAHEKAGVDAL